MTDERSPESHRIMELHREMDALREQMGADMARAEESAVFDFLNWLAPQGIEFHKLIPGGCSEAYEGELWERWKTERRE